MAVSHSFYPAALVFLIGSSRSQLSAAVPGRSRCSGDTVPRPPCCRTFGPAVARPTPLPRHVAPYHPACPLYARRRRRRRAPPPPIAAADCPGVTADRLDTSEISRACAESHGATCSHLWPVSHASASSEQWPPPPPVTGGAAELLRAPVPAPSCAALPSLVAPAPALPPSLAHEPAPLGSPLDMMSTLWQDENVESDDDDILILAGLIEGSRRNKCKNKFRGSLPGRHNMKRDILGGHKRI